MILGKKDGDNLVISKETGNKFVGIFGMPGSGKSLLGTSLLCDSMERCEKGITFNTHNCLRGSIHPDVEARYKAKTKVIHVAEEGIPLDLFAHMNINGIIENDIAVIDRVTSMIASACNLADTFKELIRMAVEEMLESNLYEKKGLAVIIDWLKAQDSSFAIRAASKIRPLCGQNFWHQGDFLQDEAEIIEFDLTGIDDSYHPQIIEFVLDYIVRKSETGMFKKTGITVYLDEAQQLSYKDLTNSPIAKLINMGRKNEITAILAMPSMYSCHKNATDLMKKCGTKCFFKPVEGEYKKIAEMLDKIKPEKAMWKLKELERGDFVALGKFHNNGSDFNGYTSGRLTFDEEEESETRGTEGNNLHSDEVA